jgi:FkbM family methyltransferase
MLKLPWPYTGQPANNDRWVHRLVFPHRKRGHYVELGAADGICGSSCHVLDRIGWTGICAEPSRAFFPALCRNRPTAICENFCVTDRTGSVRFVDDGFLSRVVYRRRHEFDRRERTVPSLMLVDLLRKHGFPKVIDYLAMDIEGSDGWVLARFPFGEYRFLAISMEGDSARGLLTRNGYVKVRNPFNTSCPWEMYYVHESIHS